MPCVMLPEGGAASGEGGHQAALDVAHDPAHVLELLLDGVEDLVDLASVPAFDVTNADHQRGPLLLGPRSGKADSASRSPCA